MNRPLRLGIVATHPIQYHAPLYRRLAADPRVEPTVLFAHRPSAEEQGTGFGVAFQWDVDLTSGFEHVWLRNRATRPSATSFDGCDTPEIGEVLRAYDFDVALLSGWHARVYWQAMLACWRGGIPMLVRGDSQLSGDSRRVKRWAKRALYPLFLRRFAACLSVGERSTEYFRYFGSRRIVASPHFVDNEHFAGAARQARAQGGGPRASFGIPVDVPLVLFAGKLTREKRPLDLVHAVARMNSATRPHVAIAGNGELRDACVAEATRLGVTVHLLGFLNQSEIPRAYAAADVLVLPSERETWGLVVNEAMACGVPAIVSTAVGCYPDLVIEGETGRGFVPGDVDALAAVLDGVLGDRSVPRRMGQAAERHIARFSADAAAEGVISAARIAVGDVDLA